MTPTPKNPDAERLYQFLRDYRLRYTAEEDDGTNGYPLVDAVTPPGAPSISFGEDELRELADELLGEFPALEQPAQEGMEHIGWEGRTVWPGVGPAGWWGMANRPEETPLAHPHTQYRRIYAGPAEGGV